MDHPETAPPNKTDSGHRDNVWWLQPVHVGEEQRGKTRMHWGYHCRCGNAAPKTSSGPVWEGLCVKKLHRTMFRANMKYNITDLTFSYFSKNCSSEDQASYSWGLVCPKRIAKLLRNNRGASLLWLNLGYTIKYSPLSQEFPWAQALVDRLTLVAS